MAVVLITGTSRGLGYELAQLYLRGNHWVFGISRSEPNISHRHYHHLKIDLTDTDTESRVRTFLDNAPIRKLDALINNAGASSDGNSISETDASDLDYHFKLHCSGPLAVIRGAMPYLNKTKIVNISSGLGSLRQNLQGDFEGVEKPYALRVAKCAQNMLSTCLMMDDALRNTIVLSVNPGELADTLSPPLCSPTVSPRFGAIALKKLVLTSEQNGFYHSLDQEVAL